MGLELLRSAYGDLSALVGDLTPEEGERPSGCAGWRVLDLTQHLVDDARRGLVALATPAGGPPTTDAVAYWRSWQPSPGDDDSTAERTRVRAGVGGGLPGLAPLYAETAAAVCVAAGRVGPGELVATQGWVLRADDLLSTLAVEAAVHHLDLVAHLDRPGPAPAVWPRCGACSRGCWAGRCRPGGTTRRRPAAAPDASPSPTPTGRRWGRRRTASPCSPSVSRRPGTLGA